MRCFDIAFAVAPEFRFTPLRERFLFHRLNLAKMGWLWLVLSRLFFHPQPSMEAGEEKPIREAFAPKARAAAGFEDGLKSLLAYYGGKLVRRNGNVATEDYSNYDYSFSCHDMTKTSPKLMATALSPLKMAKW